jgi:hypothetical protein
MAAPVTAPMALRRSSRIAAQPTTTRYLTDGTVKEQRDDVWSAPLYDGLSAQQCAQLDIDKVRIPNLLAKIAKEKVNATAVTYLNDFCKYIKEHPLLFLRLPEARASTGEWLARTYYRFMYIDHETDLDQKDCYNKLYREIRTAWDDFIYNPLYVP